MMSLLKTISKLFSGDGNQDSISDKPLEVFQSKIEITRYINMGDNDVHDSKGYLFQTPSDVLEILNGNTLLWMDNQNSLLGFSDQKKTLLFPLNKIKGIEIQNVLKGKGPAESCLWLYLYDKVYVMLSISPEIYYFDKYEDAINKTTGFTVTFSPEFYNT